MLHTSQFMLHTLLFGMLHTSQFVLHILLSNCIRLFGMLHTSQFMLHTLLSICIRLFGMFQQWPVQQIKGVLPHSCLSHQMLQSCLITFITQPMHLCKLSSMSHAQLIPYELLIYISKSECWHSFQQNLCASQPAKVAICKDMHPQQCGVTFGFFQCTIFTQEMI